MTGERLRACARAAGLRSPILWVESTASTNADLKEATPVHGTALVAGRQTAGRGRRGRTWEAPPGNLTMSVLLRPGVAARRVPLLCLAAGWVVAEAAGPRTSVKWPNDVLGPDGRKVAGILAEAAAGPVPDWVIVGVGLNVVSAPPLPTAAALADYGPPPELDALAVGITMGLLDVAHQVARDPAPLLAAWRRRSSTLGARVEVAGRRGTAVDIDADGALRLRDDAGVEHRVLAGDVAMVGGA